MLLNETQEAVRDAVRAFAQEQLRPRSAEFELAKGYPAGLFAELAALGLMGMSAPQEFWTCNGFAPVTYLITPIWLRTRVG